MLTEEYLAIGKQQPPKCVPLERAPRRRSCTMPTSCGEPPMATVEGNSMAEPARRPEQTARGLDQPSSPSGLTNCGLLPYQPVGLRISPWTSSIGAVRPRSERRSGRAYADRLRKRRAHVGGDSTCRCECLRARRSAAKRQRLKRDVESTTVKLPEGLLLGASAANGLDVCWHPSSASDSEGGSEAEQTTGRSPESARMPR